MARFDDLWAMRLKPKLDTNEETARKAWDALLEVYTPEQIIQQYSRYKASFLDSREDERYSKNLTKWLANPEDPECFQQAIRTGATGGKGVSEGPYRPGTFKVSNGLAVYNGAAGTLLLGWYQPAAAGDEWLGICTGEGRGRPDWQPVPWKMAGRYVSAGKVSAGNIEPVGLMDHREGAGGAIFQVMGLRP